MLFFLCPLTTDRSYAQEYKLSGQVRDGQGVALPHIMITLYDAADTTKIMAYGQSDQQGHFEFYADKPEAIVRVKRLEYAFFNEQVRLPKADYEIVLQEKQYQLDEVIINLNEGFASLRNDTIDYDLSKLNLRDQDDLAQILKHIPGFRVDDNAKITHNGVEINKILIDGKEVFIYQNKIALESMEKNMLDGLRVISNYQDPFAVNLSGEHEEKVIDLRVNESFKNLIKGRVEVGGGHDSKYLLKPFLYYFGRDLSVFSLNNLNNVFDKDISSEDHQSSRGAYGASSTYFDREHTDHFFNKDITLNNERVLLNSLTLRNTGDKLSAQAVFNFNKLNAIRLADTYARLFDAPVFSKNETDLLSSYFINGYLNARYKVKKNTIAGYVFSIYNDRNRSDQDFESVYFEENQQLSVMENILARSRIMSQELNFETALSPSIAFRNSISLQHEQSGDDFDLDEDSVSVGMGANPVQRIRFVGLHGAFHSNLRYQYNKHNVIALNASYFVNDDALVNSVAADSLQRMDKKLTLGLSANARYDKLRLSSTVNYNRQSLAVQDPRRLFNYFTWDVRGNYHFDAYSKNQLMLHIQRGYRAPDLKMGLSSRIISYDYLLYGNASLLNELYSLDRLAFSYNYSSPFYGRVFSVDLGHDRSSDAFVQGVGFNSIMERQYVRVEGFRRYSAGTRYGQYLFTQAYPVNAELSFRYSYSSSFQADVGADEIAIDQSGINLGLNFSSFAKKPFNFLANMSFQHNNTNFGTGQSATQQTKSYGLGPRIATKKGLEVKALLKYMETSNELSATDFFDIDLMASYVLNRHYTITLSSENALNATSMIRAQSLPFIDQTEGVEYFSTFRNPLGFVLLGVTFRF